MLMAHPTLALSPIISAPVEVEIGKVRLASIHRLARFVILSLHFSLSAMLMHSAATDDKGQLTEVPPFLCQNIWGIEAKLSLYIQSLVGGAST